jgi:hypothetical protein
MFSAIFVLMLADVRGFPLDCYFFVAENIVYMGFIFFL